MSQTSQALTERCTIITIITKRKEEDTKETAVAATKTRISKAEAVEVITITIMEREAISREEGMTLTNKVEEAVVEATKEVGMILMQEEAVEAIKEVSMILMQEEVEAINREEGMTLTNKAEVEEVAAMVEVEGAAMAATGNTIAHTSRTMAKALATATRRPCLLASITLANHANSRFGIFLVLIC